MIAGIAYNCFRSPQSHVTSFEANLPPYLRLRNLLHLCPFVCPLRPSVYFHHCACVCDRMSTLILWPPYCLPWYDPRSAPSSCPWGCDPVLLIAPGTGAPSPRPHCSPPLAALHLHLVTPSMPSPRSQTSHMARYPTATHHPSKSGSICLSQVAQCDVMLSSFTPMWPQSQPDACMVGSMHGILF